MQIIFEPTQIHGNTLDLICVNDPSLVKATKFITPDLRDHSVITAEIVVPSLQRSRHKIIL